MEQSLQGRQLVPVPAGGMASQMLQGFVEWRAKLKAADVKLLESPRGQALVKMIGEAGYKIGMVEERFREQQDSAATSKRLRKPSKPAGLYYANNGSIMLTFHPWP